MKYKSDLFGARADSGGLDDHLSGGATALPSGEVHLWYDVIDPGEDAVRLPGARDIVSADEWLRYEALPADIGGREYLAGRCMVRAVLSSYTGVPPAEWRFTAGAHGRPEVDSPVSAAHLRFDLSHADGVVACVVSAHHEVGVDVEHIGRRATVEQAGPHLAPSERAALESVPTADQPRRLLEYCTLKEAYMKARGSGLPLPLDRFAFDVLPPGRPRIAFDAGVDDDPSAWQFDRLFVGSEHVVAIATRRGTAPPVSIVVRAFDGTAPHQLLA